MNKRLKKKLSIKSKYELSKLEELMILAHRINQTETGCVFINDSPHVNWVEFRIADNKDDYNNYKNTVFYYDEPLDNQKQINLKQQLINLLEELTAKKD